jgi:SOS-response transcriptional repressor LexA
MGLISLMAIETAMERLKKSGAVLRAPATEEMVMVRSKKARPVTTSPIFLRTMPHF